MANVFISHRGADSALAERLSREIKLRGHDVWLDVLEIEIGDQIVKRISDGLAGANYVVLCYSALGSESPWMTIEWGSALARQLNGHDVTVLPAILSGGEPPAILAGTKYADLVADWDQGVADLARAIR